MRTSVDVFEIPPTTLETEEFVQYAQPTKYVVVTETPKESKSNSRKVQVYEPPPLFHTTTIFAFGCVIAFLAVFWMPLALVFVWSVARLQNYVFRINDESSTRRVLLKEFQRHDTLTAPFRHIPRGAKVEEAYWVNRR